MEGGQEQGRCNVVLEVLDGRNVVGIEVDERE